MTPPQPLLTATASCSLRGGVETGTGVILSGAQVAERVGWLTDLTTFITEQVVAERWNTTSLATLKNKVDPSGTRLPGKGHVACDRLGWETNLQDVYVPDRVYRAGKEYAMRLLRGGVYRSVLTNIILSTFPADGKVRTVTEWDALWTAIAASGNEYTRVEVANRTRAIQTYHATNDALPKDVCELEAPPRVSHLVILAAGDKQLSTVSRVDKKNAEIILKLPLVPRPQSRRDWGRVRCNITVGSHVPEHATFHSPTLRMRTEPCGASIVKVDLPFSSPTPEVLARTGKAHDGHHVAIGCDWGVNTLLTATVGYMEDTRSGVVQTDGRPYYNDGAGVGLKLHTLRKLSESLAAQIAYLNTLMGRTSVPFYLWNVRKRLDMLVAEKASVNAKRTQLGRALAWMAATWLVDLALENRATVIYVEDLRTMEGKGLGRRQNTRVSNQVRGIVLEAVRHQAAKHGISVVTVPAKGTSAQCPRCLAKHTHVVAPDSMSAGHAWARCGHCKHSANRDHAAAERIVSRGLAAQHSAHVDKTGCWRITRVVDVVVRVTRTRQSKNGKPCKPVNMKKVRCRDKKVATPSQVSLLGNSKDNSGGLRLTRPVPAANDASVSLVQCPAGTSTSLTPPLGVGQQAGNTFDRKDTHRVHSLTMRERRAQARGFHPLTYPTRVLRHRVTPLTS